MIKEINDIKILDKFSKYISVNSFSKSYGFYLNNNIIGFINFSIFYDRAELNYIWTKEEYRNKKIATTLMKKMILDCSKLKNITLEVAIDNFNAINLYKKFGFIEAAKRKGYYNGKDAILMIKEVIK